MNVGLQVIVVMVIVFVAILLGPLILLASINTLLEEAGNSTYIPHNIWTYLSCYGIMFVMKTTFKTKTK